MVDTITIWSILVAEGAAVAESLLLESAPWSNGWLSIGGLGSAELDREIRSAGWTFFYMANEIRATLFGFDRTQSIRTAVKRLIRNTTADRLNCLEITNVAGKRFLGLPYVSVTAHSRHIQQHGLVGALTQDSGADRSRAVERMTGR